MLRVSTRWPGTRCRSPGGGRGAAAASGRIRGTRRPLPTLAGQMAARADGSPTSARRPRPRHRGPPMTLANATASETGERLAAARVEGLTKIYGSGETRVVALDDVTLDLYAGEFTAIMGTSGSGKSTLMHCVAGLDSATPGHVFIGDTDLTGSRTGPHRAPARPHRLRVPGLQPRADADRGGEHRAAARARRPPPDQAWFDEVVDTVGLRDRLAHRPSELSGGQQQRVACARALAGRPDVVFADEPTGNLDSRRGPRCSGSCAGSSTTHGQTVVMVTHDPGAAELRRPRRLPRRRHGRRRAP